MKLFLCFLVVSLGSFSCSPIESRKAGGGAWDDTPVGQALDANAPLPEDSFSGGQSYEQWRRR